MGVKDLWHQKLLEGKAALGSLGLVHTICMRVQLVTLMNPFKYIHVYILMLNNKILTTFIVRQLLYVWVKSG